MILALGALVALNVVATASPVVYNTATDLPYDENGKLASHIVVYPDGNPTCGAAKFADTEGFITRAVAGEALQAIFPGASEGDCQAACLELGGFCDFYRNSLLRICTFQINFFFFIRYRPISSTRGNAPTPLGWNGQFQHLV